MFTNKLHRLFLLIIVLSGTYLNSLSAEHVNYWDLSPQSSVEVDDKILYAYSAKVLLSRSTNTLGEFLLQIKDGHDKRKFNQTWVKFNLDQDTISVPYSMGDDVIVFIDPNHTDKLIIDGSFYVYTPWAYADGESWIIPSTPNQVSSLTFKGVDYLIYPGEVEFLNYAKQYDGDGYTHTLEIDIKIQGVECKHFHDFQKQYAQICDNNGKHYLKEEQFLNNIYILRLRHWSISDQIVILVNSNFPGFWWVFNQSRNEAISVARGQALEHTGDLWSRLGN
ncbi:MAG TPA: hypothetical protein VGP47_10935 [Parachlamydiaceae bacterium]|nr:hypothetical protein [Parachlamydiaceae bacterium]